MTLESEFWDKSGKNNKSFLICAIRNADEEEKKNLEKKIIPEIENQGYKVHYPLWHTNQIDPIGYNICRENENGIKESVVVHMLVNPTSKGSAFDAGITFYYQNPLKLVNPEAIKDNLSNNFLKIIYEYALNTNEPYSALYDGYLHRKEDLDSDYLKEICYDMNPAEISKDSDFLFGFGMAFASRRKISLQNYQRVLEYELANDFENIDDASKVRIKDITKSFNKVLLCTHYVTNGMGSAEDFYKYYAEQQKDAYNFIMNTS